MKFFGKSWSELDRFDRVLFAGITALGFVYLVVAVLWLMFAVRILTY